MNPEISVIVATRNRSRVLKTALDGIAAQSCSNFELLVLDDGSGPQEAASNRALVEAAGGRYEYIGGNPLRGSGPSFPRNRGVELAEGDLIAFCDDDDLWIDKDHLQSCVQLYTERPELDLVFANQEDHRNGSTVLSLRLPRLVRALGIGRGESGAGYPVPMKYRFLEYFPHLNTCVFRKSLLLSAGGFWEGVSYTEDLDLYVRVADIAREVVYRDKTVAIHNVPEPERGESASTRLRDLEKQLAIAHVAQHLLASCSSRQAVRYARLLGGEQTRVLALAAHKRAAGGSALEFAKLALAYRFSWKWALFTCQLMLKELAGRRS